MKRVDELQKDRVIRVFISSTFKDMKEERDELVKFVFPQIKKLCTERQVVWGEVDLRWGITEEQKAEGKVLPICLQEIKKCRPYFIGILGERYGWVPDEIEPEIVGMEPWLTKNQDRSVTELEIMHGVLNDPDMAGHAFFYFRSKEYLQKLPPDIRKDYIENASPEEEGKYGNQKAALRVQDRKSKLSQLKDRIRKSNFPLKDNYSDPKAFGEMVQEDLTNLIDKLFPAGSIPDTLDREARIHENFALNRCKCYIGGEKYFSEIDKHFESNTLPLIITGESGTGKSSLLSNWATRYKRSHPETKVLMHFIGTSNYSADLIAMLKRIIGDLSKHFNIPFEIPAENEKIKLAFTECLAKVATRGECILILDALNKLEDKDQALELGWLPPNIPGKIRIIISTLPGRCLDIMQKRGWPVMSLKPFNDNDKRSFIHDYLEQYSKTLSEDIINKIVSGSQTSNPLFMQTLLEELRIYGDHQTLKERCDLYLQAKDPVELFRKLFSRYETDYEKERPGLIEDTLTAIWASRHGLSEDELISISQVGEKETLRHHWSRFYIPAEHLFMITSGLLNFSYDYLRTAVEQHYLSRSFVKSQAHLKIANYFSGYRFLVVDEKTGLPDFATMESKVGQNLVWVYAEERLISEISWQYFKAEQWNSLYNLLSKPAFHARCYFLNIDEVNIYWTAIQNNSDLSFLKAYRDLPSNMIEMGEFELIPLSQISKHFGGTEISFAITEFLMEKLKNSGDRSGYLDRKREQAWNYHLLGQDSTALKLLMEVEQEGRKIQAHDVVQLSLIEQGSMLHWMGDFEQSLIVQKKAEEICMATNSLGPLSNCLYMQAANLNHLGRFDEAMNILDKSMRVAVETNNIAQQILILGELAHNYLRRDSLKKAIEFIEKKENLCLLTGNIKSLALAYHTHAIILSEEGKDMEALRYLKIAEEKSVEAGSLSGIAAARLSLGMTLLKMNSFEQAEPLLLDAIERFKGIGDTIHCGDGIEALSRLYNKTGKYSKALDLCDAAIRLFIMKGRDAGVARCVKLKASVLGNLGRLDEIFRLKTGLMQLAKETSQSEHFNDFDGGHGIFLMLNIWKEWKDKEIVARKDGDFELLGESIITQVALILKGELELDHLLPGMLDEAEEACNKSNYIKGLTKVNYYRGKILNSKGQHEKCLPYLKQAEKLANDSDYGFMLTLIWYENGLLNRNKGWKKEAIDWIKLAIEGFIKFQMDFDLGIAEKVLKELQSEIGQTPDDQVAMDQENVNSVNPPVSEIPMKSASNEETEESFETILGFSSELPGISNLSTLDIRGKQRVLNAMNVFIAEGATKRALVFLKELKDHFIKFHRFQDLSAVLELLGNVLSVKNKIEQAIVIFAEQEGVCKSLNDNSGIARALHNQALIHRELGQIKEAVELLQKEEIILIALNDSKSLENNLREQCQVFKISGRMDFALAICEKRETLCISINEKKGLADSYTNHGAILSDIGRSDEALKMQMLSVKIYRELEDKAGLQISLGNLAISLSSEKNYAEALELCIEKEAICREIDDQKELAIAYGIQALVYLEQEEPDKAFEYFNKEEKICRDIHAEEVLQVSVGNKAALLMRFNKKEEVLPLLKEKETICRKLNISYGLCIALMNQAIVHYETGNIRESQSYAKEAMELAKKCGYSGLTKNLDGLLKAIENQLKKRTSQNSEPLGAREIVSNENSDSPPNKSTIKEDHDETLNGETVKVNQSANEVDTLIDEVNEAITRAEDLTTAAQWEMALKNYNHVISLLRKLSDLTRNKGYQELGNEYSQFLNCNSYLSVLKIQALIKIKYLVKNNRPAEAKLQLDKYQIELQKATNDSSIFVIEIIDFYQTIGDLYRNELNDFNNAESAYNNALLISEKRNEKNRDSSDSSMRLLISYHNLGRFYQETKNIKKARQYYKKAEIIGLKLVRAEPENPLHITNLVSIYASILDVYTGISNLFKTIGTHSKIGSMLKLMKMKGISPEEWMLSHKTIGPFWSRK